MKISLWWYFWNSVLLPCASSYFIWKSGVNESRREIGYAYWKRVINNIKSFYNQYWEYHKNGSWYRNETNIHLSCERSRGLIAALLIQGWSLAHSNSNRHSHKQPQSMTLNAHRALYIQDIHTTLSIPQWSQSVIVNIPHSTHNSTEELFHPNIIKLALPVSPNKNCHAASEYYEEYGRIPLPSLHYRQESVLTLLQFSCDMEVVLSCVGLNMGCDQGYRTRKYKMPSSREATHQIIVATQYMGFFTEQCRSIFFPLFIDCCDIAQNYLANFALKSLILYHIPYKNSRNLKLQGIKIRDGIVFSQFSQILCFANDLSIFWACT